MRKYVYIVVISLSLCGITGCNTCMIHQSKDGEWYTEQLQKRDAVPTNTQK